MGRTLHGTKSSKFEFIETKPAGFPHFLGSFSPAGCSASWRGGRAAPRRTCVTCLQRWTPSSPPWPSSTSSTKSCWGLSCTDEASSALNGVSVRLFFYSIIFLKLFWLFLTTVLGCFHEFSLGDYLQCERRGDASINQRLAWLRTLPNDIDIKEDLNPCVIIYFLHLNKRICQINSPPKKGTKHNTLLLNYHFRCGGVPLQHITAWVRSIISSR